MICSNETCKEEGHVVKVPIIYPGTTGKLHPTESKILCTVHEMDTMMGLHTMPYTGGNAVPPQSGQSFGKHNT